MDSFIQSSPKKLKSRASRASQETLVREQNKDLTHMQSSPGSGHQSAGNGAGHGGQAECYGCRKPIRERFLLRALEQTWHEDCLKCSCCDCRLGEVGSTLFTKANLILCKRDYLR